MGANGSIQDWGQEPTRECLAFYIDKAMEGRHRELLMRNEAERAEKRSPAAQSAAEPLRAAVTYLLMENAARTMHLDLLLSLHCLSTFFGAYPVIVFHTNGSTPEELAYLRDASPARLRLSFELVELGFPPAVSGFPGGPDAFLAAPMCVMDGRHWWSTHRSCGCRCPAWRPRCWPENWMHCTRFFTAGMFRTRAFQKGDFEYFLRMDTDLFFVRRPLLDPFHLMAERGCALVYDVLSREAPGCFDGFDERTMEFIQDRGYHGQIDEEVLHIGSGPAAAGGQWTLGDARLFRDTRYLEFADFVAGGIYAHRWADQLLLMRGAALFGPRSGHAATPGLPDSAATICLRELFEGGVSEGFVHTKGGFNDASLVEHCGASGVFG